MRSRGTVKRRAGGHARLPYPVGNWPASVLHFPWGHREVGEFRNLGTAKSVVYPRKQATMVPKTSCLTRKWTGGLASTQGVGSRAAQLKEPTPPPYNIKNCGHCESHSVADVRHPLGDEKLDRGSQFSFKPM